MKNSNFKYYLLLKLSISCFIFFSLPSCKQATKEKEIITGVVPYAECKGMPSFPQLIGFNMHLSAFSTSEKRLKGIALIQYDTDMIPMKYYQHPTWKAYGNLGPFCFDDKGNLFVAPVPMINVLENKPIQQNYLYMLSGKNQVLTPLLNLPHLAEPNSQNPYGVMGLNYDCNSKIVYASSIMGSTIDKEMGQLFAIKNNTVVATYKNIDAIGLAANSLNGKRRLFFGKARESEIWSIALNEEGIFEGEPRLELSLDGLGPSGDDKARKIRFDDHGQMLINGVNFYYNLIAPSEKQETVYTCIYDKAQGKWVVRLIN